MILRYHKNRCAYKPWCYDIIQLAIVIKTNPSASKKSFNSKKMWKILRWSTIRWASLISASIILWSTASCCIGTFLQTQLKNQTILLTILSTHTVILVHLTNVVNRFLLFSHTLYWSKFQNYYKNRRDFLSS